MFALRARGLRTTAKSVRRWESDHGNTPRADILPALADAFGVSLDHLYATEEAKAEVEVDMDAALAIGVAVVKAMQQMQPAAAR